MTEITGLMGREDSDMGTRGLGAPGGEIKRRPAFRTVVGNNKEFASALRHGRSLAPAARHVQLFVLTPAAKGMIMALTTLTDRRNGRSPSRILTIADNALVWRNDDSTREVGAEPGIAFDDVRQVRLSVEMAGQASQVVCRVTSSAGDEIAFGSMRCTGPGQWEANARDFQTFLQALHAALQDRPGPVNYIEGSSVKFLTVMTAIGGLLAVSSGAAFAKFFLIDENALGLILIPAVALGVWMMRLFWPRAPKRYDPATYINPTKPDDPCGARADDAGVAG